MSLEIHPAANVFPMRSEAELTELRRDIALNGLLEPIVLCDGMILDGRARADCCFALQMPLNFVEAELADLTPMQYAVVKNLPNRNLSVPQRAVLALDLLPEIEAAADERMALGGRISKRGHPLEKEAPDLESIRKKEGQSGRIAAALVGVGHSTVFAVKAIAKRNPELIEQLRTGEIATVAEAAREAGYPRLGQSDHKGRKLGMTDKNGRVPAFGKGDKWEEATTPLRRYLNGWGNRGFAFKHLNPREARKRLRIIEEIEQGLSAARDDLERRSHKATLRVEG